MNIEKQLAPDIPLGRFATTKRHFRKDKTPRPDLFTPYPYEELSVFRIDGFGLEEVKRLGKEVVRKSGKTLYGYATLTVEEIESSEESLKIIYDNEPPRHANIAGWPSEKSKQKLYATKLAEKVIEKDSFTLYNTL